MPSWFEEFFVVTGASRRLQITLLAIPVVPSLIVVFGTLQLDRAVSAGPYAVLVDAVRQGTSYLYLAVALSACISCIRIAAKEYRRVHKRIFG